MKTLKVIILSDSFVDEKHTKKEEYNVAYDQVEGVLSVLQEKLDANSKYLQFEKRVEQAMKDMKTFGQSLAVWTPKEIQVRQ